MDVRREISRSEHIYVGEIRTRAVTLCVVRGGVDEDLLDAALAAVLAEHRSLRSRIERDGDGYVMRLLDPRDLPRLLVRPAEPGTLVQEYNTPMPLGGPMVRAVLLRGPAQDTLVLSVDHAICDGRSATALCYQLWKRYAEIQADTYTTPAGAGETWPPPIDDLLPSRTESELEAYVRSRLERAKGQPVAALPFLAAGSGDLPSEQGAMSSRRVWLTREQTVALLAFAKSVAVSVHGLVGAALLGAIRAGLPERTASHRLSCVSTVDLRQRVQPELSRDVMVAAASWYQDILDVPAGAALIGLGRLLSANLRAGVGRGDAALELQSLDRLAAHPELWTASLVMPNVGSVAGPPSPPGLEIVDMSKFPVSSKWNPEIGQGALIASPMTIYGRLSIEMPYSARCFTPAQMDAVHDRVLATLLEFAERAPVPVG
jgi:hypothetical protein